MPRLYFGHPINTYNTTLEERLLRKISLSFPSWEIENPNQQHHQEQYERWKETTGTGMNYFIKQVLPNCHGGIFLPFRDGAWPSGVFMEAKFIADKGWPIWMIVPSGDITALSLSRGVSLTREETISRVRTASGEIIPY
ncbi:MAG: hypothetical protein HZC04_01070 [Candidatus Lloydbacteria bacterium]|nr:hypothetical protein [Candidatus Lloydbacteria bacterium]